MGHTKIKKIDMQRYKKVYPYKRVEKVIRFLTEKPIIMEEGFLDFSNEAGPKTYTFLNTYITLPSVTGISVSNNGSDANVNIFINELTNSHVSFSASDTFTGKISFHVVRIGESSEDSQC